VITKIFFVHHEKTRLAFRGSALWRNFHRRAHISGNALNSLSLRQHKNPAPLSCTRLGCQTMGVKIKIPNLRIQTLTVMPGVYPSIFNKVAVPTI